MCLWFNITFIAFCFFIFMLPSYYFIYYHVLSLQRSLVNSTSHHYYTCSFNFNIVWLATSRSITSPVVSCTLCPFEFIITLTTVHVFVHYEHVIFNHLNIDYALLHVIKSIYFFLLVFTTQDCIEFHYFIN